ncbi:MAG: MAPEG family protein [Pseudomonadota bacterium]
MAGHVGWTAALFGLLTVTRAPDAWGIGRRADGTNPWAEVERRVSANLRNQFEWPLMFYVACGLFITGVTPITPLAIGIAWLFVAGRVLHSGVQILTRNVRLRGVVFSINFLAVIGLWVLILRSVD